MWPFAIRHAVNFHNSSIRRDKNRSPYHLFTGQESPWNLSDFRVFGCPVYVLNKKLQDGDNFSKWRPRSWQGVYIGHSNCHASNVPLICNPRTTHVSPQYHLVFDEGFTSKNYPSLANTDDFLNKLHNTSSWDHKSIHADAADMYYFDSFWMDPPLPAKPQERGRKRKQLSDSTHIAPTKMSPTEGVTSLPTQVSEGDPLITCPYSNNTFDMNKHSKNTPDLHETTGETPDIANHRSETGDSPTNLEYTGDSPTNIIKQGDPPTKMMETGEPPIITNDNGDSPALQAHLSEKTSHLDPTTLHTPTHYHIYHGSTDFRAYKQQKGIHGHIYVPQSPKTPVSSVTTNPCTDNNVTPIMHNIFSSFTNLPPIFTDTTLTSFLALNNKEDTLTQSQMRKSHDHNNFINAQNPEIRGLEQMNVFDYKAMETLPPNARLLSSIWSYPRKRQPNGALLKHKARICVDGSKQLLG